MLEETVYKIRQVIKMRVDELGLTSSSLARKMDMHRSNVVAFTSQDKKWNPSIKSLLEIAKALDLPLETFFVEHKDPSMLALINDLKSEIKILAKVPTKLPLDILEALEKVQTEAQFEVIRAVLLGMGLLKTRS